MLKFGSKPTIKLNFIALSETVCWENGLYVDRHTFSFITSKNYMSSIFETPLFAKNEGFWLTETKFRNLYYFLEGFLRFIDCAKIIARKMI